MSTPCAVTGCERGGRRIRGWCKFHWQRWSRTGNPEVSRKRPKGEIPAILRHAATLTGEGPCHYPLAHQRRPIANLDGEVRYASRHVWTLANGDPGDMWVLHTCGNGTDGCLRLGHLYLGTQQDNIADQIRDGRLDTSGLRPGR